MNTLFSKCHLVTISAQKSSLSAAELCIKFFVAVRTFETFLEDQFILDSWVLSRYYDYLMIKFPIGISSSCYDWLLTSLASWNTNYQSSETAETVSLLWAYLVGAAIDGVVSSGLDRTSLGPGTYSSPECLGSFFPTRERNYYQDRDRGQEDPHLGSGSEVEVEAGRLSHDLWSLLTVAWRTFGKQVGEGGS